MPRQYDKQRCFDMTRCVACPHCHAPFNAETARFHATEAGQLRCPWCFQTCEDPQGREVQPVPKARESTDAAELDV